MHDCVHGDASSPSFARNRRVRLSTSFGWLEIRIERSGNKEVTVAELAFPHAIGEPFELSHRTLGLWRMIKRPMIFDSPRQVVLRVSGSRIAAKAVLQSDARGVVIALAEMSDEFVLSEHRLRVCFFGVFDEAWEYERLVDRARLLANYLEQCAQQPHSAYR